MVYPMISVITPSLNAGRYIEAAIESVIAQNYPNYEHIVIDGGSSDATTTILERHSHLQWVSKPDQGQSDAMNKGFDRAAGDVIVYLNADDYFKPDAFHAVAREIVRGARFIVGQVRVLKPEGKGFLNDPKVELEEMLRWWQQDAFCYNSAGYFYLREIQEQVGPFNVEDHFHMDFEFLIKARLVTEFCKIPDELACFRLIPGTKTFQNTENEQVSFKRFDHFLALVSASEQRNIRSEKAAFFGDQDR